MINLDLAIVVEGKYDKIRLENIFDTIIVTTDGFGIYNSKKIQATIKKLAETCGIIILTDSDSSGLQIRNHIKEIAKSGVCCDVFLPQIKGKEKRKVSPSSQGFLGVEGISDNIIVSAFEKFITNSQNNREPFADTALLYNDGLVGRQGSKVLRKKLLLLMDLPDNLSTNDLVKVLNRLYSYEEYEKMLEKCKFNSI